jgi:hypothetical protein
VGKAEIIKKARLEPIFSGLPPQLRHYTPQLNTRLFHGTAMFHKRA